MKLCIISAIELAIFHLLFKIETTKKKENTMRKNDILQTNSFSSTPNLVVLIEDGQGAILLRTDQSCNASVRVFRRKRC